MKLTTETPLIYQGESCQLRAARYAENKRIALFLVSEPDGYPILTLTVNDSTTPLAPDEVIVKNWSENVGVDVWAEAAGILGLCTGHVRMGFVRAPIHHLPTAILHQLKELP